MGEEEKRRQVRSARPGVFHSECLLTISKSRMHSLIRLCDHSCAYFSEHLWVRMTWQAPNASINQVTQVEPVTPSEVFGLYSSMASLNCMWIFARPGG